MGGTSGAAVSWEDIEGFEREATEAAMSLDARMSASSMQAGVALQTSPSTVASGERNSLGSQSDSSGDGVSTGVDNSKPTGSSSSTQGHAATDHH
jgi:hypothetical protein